jgi:biotin operon repressor
MLKDIEKFFGSAARVRIMRYFLSHREESMTTEHLAQVTKMSKQAVSKEINFLKKLGFLQEMIIEEFYENIANNKKVIKSKKLSGVSLNKDYNYNESLAVLLLDFRFIDKKALSESFKIHGKVKLLVLGGIFTGEEKSKLDILVVGDSLDKSGIEKAIKNIEAEMGTELRYSAFETDEYQYRLTMYDRFLRDFIRSNVDVLVEKISTRV